VISGRDDRKYGYFVCASRHHGSRTCTLRYLPERLVERAVAAQWQREQIPSEDLPQLREALADDFSQHQMTATAAFRRAHGRVHAIKRERFKWAEKAMEGTVPDDIAREKQTQLAQQLLRYEAELARLQTVGESHQAALEAVLTFIEQCGDAYQTVPSDLRRIYNQSWFEWLEIDEDDEGVSVTVASQPDLVAVLRSAEVAAHGPDCKQRVDQPEPYRVNGKVRGSNVPCLVELRGFEPLASSLRTRRATNCATAPERQSLADRDAQRPDPRVSR
jgi:site-specific DNA recombinase